MKVPASIRAPVDNMAKVRGIERAALEGFANMAHGYVKKQSAEKLDDWMRRQIYIALGTALTAAAAIGVDSTPMEGFNPPALDEVLGLDKLGLESVLLLPVGFRHEDDNYAKLAKVRFPLDEVVIRL